MQKIIKNIISFFQKLFGQITYTNPIWFEQLKIRIRQEPLKYKKIFYSLGGLVGVALLMFFGKAYYNGRPKPEATTFKVNPISAYNFEKPEVRSLYISFSKSVANVNLMGKALTEGIKLKPEIKGQWVWASDTQLKFTPLVEKGKLDWPVGQKYVGEISRKILSQSIYLENNDFEFKTEDLKATVSTSSFYQDPRFADNKKVTATFRFNYPVDPESLKKRIELFEKKENGFEVQSKYEISTSFDEFKSQLFVQSSNIKIDESNKEFKFVLEKGYASSYGGTSLSDTTTSIKVPSLYDYFRINSAGIVIVRNEKFESEQILRLENISEIATEELAKSLEVYELPLRSLQPENEDEITKKKNKPYRWSSVSEITPEVLQKAKKINAVVIPSERTISLEHSFQFSSSPGRSLYIKISKNATSFGGFKLKEDYEKVVLVPAYPSDLQIMGKGSLIPLSGSQQLSLVSRNVNKIVFDLHQIRLEQINHLIPGLLNDFAKPDSYEVRPDQIAERFEGEVPLINKNPQKSQFSSINLSPYLNSAAGKKGLFLLSVRSKDSTAFVSDQRFIILTDIGMIVKRSLSGGYDIFVQNLSSGLPSAGVKVSVLGQNGISVLTAETNINGLVSFPNLKDFKNDKQPIAFVAAVGESISFVPFMSYSRELDLTSFDTGGTHDSSESDELNAFIFSDRGIYRPGEKTDLGLVVRSKNWGKSFSQIPVDIVIQNPSGQEISKQTIKVSSNSMESFSFKGEDYFPTGNYSVYAYVRQNKNQLMIGSTTFQVEEFLPDQIKVRTTLSQAGTEGWIQPKNLKLNLSAYTLYGTPASERLAKSKIRMRPTNIYFKKWKDYYFNLPQPTQLEINDSLVDQKTNNNGEVEWSLNLDQIEKSIYRLNIDSEVFQTEGGKSVKSQLSQLVSNQDYVLGFKTQALDLSFIKKDVDVSLNLVTINSKLESVAVKNIEVDLIEKKPTSVLTRLPNDTYAYQTVYKETLLKSIKISTLVKDNTFKIETGKVGEFHLVFKDADKNELNRLTYNVIGTADIERGLEKSSILKLGLNKKDYKQNETIEIQIKSPYAGAGLITIERDKVYVSKWFKSTNKSSVQTIQIPAGLEGQAYIVVTMLRDQKADDIYTSPLAYAAVPFGIDLEARRSKIEISAPDQVKPGETLNFKVKADQKTKAAIYLVDEGILQVANYKLPQPVNYFFQKKALQVTTSQILDLVMPDFSRMTIGAAGGDESARLGQSINPFKRKNIEPVTYWVGIKDLKSEWTTFQYRVPDHFNGSLKLMVVAANDNKLGSSAVDVHVRGDFIISATSTTFSSPGDEFEVNLIIANQLKGSGPEARVDIDIKAGNGFNLVDYESKKIEPLIIPENKEKSFNFKVKTLEKLGSHSIVISAGIGNKKAKVELSISNRPSVPYQQKIDWVVLTGGQPMDLKPWANMRSEFRQNELQAHSTVYDIIKPFESFYSINNYLCTEQVASQLMPLVLKNSKNSEDASKVNRLISILRARQKTQGAFSLYPTEDNVQYDTSLHLGMIFLYMQEKGEPIPQDIWQRYLQSLKTEYNQTQTKVDLYRKAKAIYILLRSQFVPKSDLKNMATLVTDKNYQSDITSTAAYYLAASFKLAQQDEYSRKALSLAQKNKDVKLPDTFTFDRSEDFENQALILRHFSDKNTDLFSSKTFFDLIEMSRTFSLNTYSSSYLMMSLDLLMKQTAASSSLDKITAKALADDKSVSELKFNTHRTIEFSEKTQNINLFSTDVRPVLLSYIQGGYSRNNEMQEKSDGIEISRTFESEDGHPLSQVPIGSEVIVKIRARTKMKKNSAIIINDLLPAGFEVVLNSVRQNKMNNNENSIDEEGEVEPSSGPSEGESEEGAQYWPLHLILNSAYAQATSNSSIPVMWTDLVDVREDRVNIYVNLDENMKEYTYKIKATSKGTYRVPGIYAKGMYRTDMIGQGASSLIKVE